MTQWLASLFPNLRDAAIRWSEDDASSFAASVAYYMALSLFPIIVLLTSVLGLVLQYTEIGHSTDRQIQNFLDTIANNGSEQLAATLRDILSQLRLHSVIACPSALAATILAALGVFAQLDRGLDRIWRVETQKSKSMKGTVQRVLRDRFWAFTMLVSLGGAIALVFVANMFLGQVRSLTGKSLPSLNHIFHFVDLAFTIGTNALLFAAAYRFLPKKHVGWRESLRGGLLAAVVWELGRVLLGMFFIGMRYTTAYGALGSFIALLLWCYYGISIFYFGAEYVQVLQRQRPSTPTLPNPTLEVAPPLVPRPLPDPHPPSAFLAAADSGPFATLAAPNIPSEPPIAARMALTSPIPPHKQRPRRSLR